LGAQLIFYKVEEGVLVLQNFGKVGLETMQRFRQRFDKFWRRPTHIHTGCPNKSSTNKHRNRFLEQKSADGSSKTNREPV